MKKILLALVVSLLLLLVVSCASSSQLYDLKYPKISWLCAIGSGYTHEDAVRSAKEELSQTFRAEIDSYSNFYQTSTATNGSEFTDFSSMGIWGSIESSTELMGVEVANTWKDKDGLVYARVAMNRKKSGALIKEKAQPLSIQLEQNLKVALAEKDALAAIRALNMAKDNAAELEVWNLQLQLLGQDTFDTHYSEIFETLAKRKAEIVVSCSTNNEDLKTALLGALSEAGYSTSEKATNWVLTGSLKTTELVMTSSPYKYCSWEVSVSLDEGNANVLAFQENGRETAITQEDANAQASITAKKVAAEALKDILQ